MKEEATLMHRSRQTGLEEIIEERNTQSSKDNTYKNFTDSLINGKPPKTPHKNKPNKKMN